MKKTILRLLSSAMIAGALLATGSAAGAAEPSPAAGRTSPHVTKIPVSGGIGILSYNQVCFGYTGTFKDGSDVMAVDWEDADFNPDECFGIAPNRTIWHAWPGSGGWKEMPNNGRADDTIGAFENAAGRRGVMVWVASVNGIWCSVRNAGPGWAAWYRC